MIIDTAKVGGWAAAHSKIVVPIATGLLSWWAAHRWQAAIDSHSMAFCIYYFFVTAASGVTTIVLVVNHFMRLGFLE